MGACACIERGALCYPPRAAADVPGCSLLGDVEQRIRNSIVALAAAAPFWLPGNRALLQQLGELVAGVQVRLADGTVHALQHLGSSHAPHAVAHLQAGLLSL